VAQAKEAGGAADAAEIKITSLSPLGSETTLLGAAMETLALAFASFSCFLFFHGGVQPHYGVRSPAGFQSGFRVKVFPKSGNTSRDFPVLNRLPGN